MAFENYELKQILEGVLEDLERALGQLEDTGYHLLIGNIEDAISAASGELSDVEDALNEENKELRKEELREYYRNCY